MNTSVVLALSIAAISLALIAIIVPIVLFFAMIKRTKAESEQSKPSEETDYEKAVEQSVDFDFGTSVTKPIVLYMRLDNQEDVYKNFKSSECEVISGGVETILETWSSGYPCVMKRLSSGRYITVMDENGLRKLIDGKFDILKSVREYKYNDKPVNMTMSIGVGRGKTLAESDEYAVSALEMSQARGGDQATVNSYGAFEFYGGMVGRTTSSNKVRARIIASTIADQIKNSDIVFATGHAYSDLDSIGACIGIYEIAKALEKPCYILSDKEKSMAKSLIDKFISETETDIFVDEEKARELMADGKNCLIVVDTHRPNSVEFPELTENFDSISVIDHHRRNANYIRDTVVYYDEPNASSACELVTEILQYIPAKASIMPCSAAALLSGIMLDTRNFVLGTGVRTFEAAAYLKGNGADTVTVRQLFAGNIENYKAKAEILATARPFKDCIIAVANKDYPDIRIIASQVADEMLSVSGTKSTYVLFKRDNSVCISARSLGEMNVQVIMEALGGGGHFTMAATQIEGTTIDLIILQLEDVITKYFEME